MNHGRQTKKTFASRYQSISSEEQKKRMKLAFKSVGFDTSDEDGNIIPDIYLYSYDRKQKFFQ
jgi:hypothetical protein